MTRARMIPVELKPLPVGAEMEIPACCLAATTNVFPRVVYYLAVFGTSYSVVAPSTSPRRHCALFACMVCPSTSPHRSLW